MIEKVINRYFFFLLSFLPISFLIGPSVSLTNILIFDFSFIFLLFYKKDWSWIKNPTIKILLILYLYLIFNQFIALDWNLSFFRNFGFLRLIVFFVGVNYFFYNNENFYKVFIIWSAIIFVVVFDIFIEKVFGTNILGYGYGHERVVSFFKDEQIPGGFVYAFSLMLFGYYVSKSEDHKKYFKIFTIIALILFLVAIISTGERSNSFKAFFSFILFLFLFKEISFFKKLFLLGLVFLIISLVILSNDYLKNRLFNSVIYAASNFKSSFVNYDPHNNPGLLYAKLARSSYEVFKNYPYFGVGNKNYRFESCKNKIISKNIHIMRNNYVCSSHPHQIYYEFLSEHGLIGTLILLVLFFLIFYKILNLLFLSKNYIGIGTLSYLIAVFTPLLPSGQFFTDYNISLFFINLSIMYATTQKANIFSK